MSDDDWLKCDRKILVIYDSLVDKTFPKLWRKVENTVCYRKLQSVGCDWRRRYLAGYFELAGTRASFGDNKDSKNKAFYKGMKGEFS